MDNLNTRDFEAADTEQVVEIMLQAFGSKFGMFFKWDDRKLGKMITKYYINHSRNSRIIVAEENGRILGFIKLLSKRFMSESSSPIQPDSSDNITIFDKIKYFISTVIPFFSSIKKDECYVTLIGVAEAGRGNGTGTRLMEEGEKIALSIDGHSRYTLYVMKENPRAFKLYESLGFRARQEITFPLFKRLTGFSAVIFMEKNLATCEMPLGRYLPAPQ